MIHNRFGTRKTLRALAMVWLAAIAGMSLSQAALAAGGDTNTRGSQDTPTSELADPTTAASNPLSDAGSSGYHLYRRHCASCHGRLAQGTERGGSLIRTRYSKHHLSREELHEQFRRATREHAKVARGTRDRPGPRFNDVELIGKFLREIEAWYAMLERSEAEN